MVMKRFEKAKPRRFANGDRGKRMGQGVEKGGLKGPRKGSKRDFSLGSRSSSCNKGSIDAADTPIDKPISEPRGTSCKICTLLTPKKQLIYAMAWTQSDIQTASPVPIRGSEEDPGSPQATVQRLQKRLLKKYGITRADCEHHARVCIARQEDSRYSRVAAQFDQLWTALDLAHSVYMDDPSMFNAQAYTALVRELRGCLMDLNKVQSSDEVADEIVQTALTPLVKRFTSAVISEASRMKDDLLARFPEEEADKMVNTFVERLAVQIQDTVPYARDRIADALSARDKNRKKAMQGKATMQRGKAQGLPASSSEQKGKLLSLPVG